MIATAPTQADVRRLLAWWLPALSAGGAAWLLFLIVGGTPLIRASGMALAVVGMSMALRSMGAALSFLGGVALAISPSFWIQTGGAESLNPLEVVGAGLAALVVGIIALRIGRRPLWGIGVALAIFAVMFLVFVGQPRSLRLTTLVSAWTLFLLVDALLVSNPHPNEIKRGELGAHHIYGLLLLCAVGVANDPLFALMLPAVAFGLFLVHAPVWTLIALVALFAWGVIGITNTYVDPNWFPLPAEIALTAERPVPFVVAALWREPLRWIRLIELVAQQFTVVGLGLGILGLARWSRWHPPVGVVTMIAYGVYAWFGLTYLGADAPVLLLPLLMIQLLWMTYAVYTFGQWMGRRSHKQPAA